MSSESSLTPGQIRALIVARHNAALIRGWASGFGHAALRADLMRRYAIERAFILIAEAIKDVPLPYSAKGSARHTMAAHHRFPEFSRAHLR